MFAFSDPAPPEKRAHLGHFGVNAPATFLGLTVSVSGTLLIAHKSERPFPLFPSFGAGALVSAALRRPTPYEHQTPGPGVAGVGGWGT